MQPLKQALLCYVLPAEKCGPMNACLATLVAELRARSLAPGDHSATASRSTAPTSFIRWTTASSSSLASREFSAVMHGLEDDTDPSPLLLVYNDDDSPDEQHRNLYRQILLQKFVATLVCDANLLPVGQTHSTTPREWPSRH